MDTLLHLIFKDKQFESYNLLCRLEDIKCMLRQQLCLDNLESRMAQVEGSLISYSASQDHTNPPFDLGDYIDPPMENMKNLT